MIYSHAPAVAASLRLLQKPADAATQHRMPPVRRDLGQRHQYEGAPMHLGMRQDQLTRPAAACSRPTAGRSPGQNIKIKRARTPMPAEPPSGGPFQALQQAQKRRWRKIRPNPNDRVEELRLPSATHRRGLENV